MSKIILPPDSEIYQTFQEIVAQRRIAFLVGLPGTGKSLLLQQLALMAQQAGRIVHLLQYDVARMAFETAENRVKYPEIDGFTHAAIRKAVGLWARAGVAQWRRQHPTNAHFLLGELPLVGNRLSELMHQIPDKAESILAGDETFFVLPVPSHKIRAVIESAREKSIAQPSHAKEAQDAQLNVLQALWDEVAQVAYEIRVSDLRPSGKVAYDAGVYTAVYQHLLTHRQYKTLPINTILKPTTSVYDLRLGGTELAANSTEVQQIINKIEQQYTPQTLEHAVSRWFEVGS